MQIIYISMPGYSEWWILLIGIVWISTVIEVATSRFRTSGDKITWLLIVTILGLIGSLIYAMAGRRMRI